MSATYAGTDTYDSTYELPLDNEPVTAKSVSDIGKALGNRTAFLLRRLGEVSHSGSGIRLYSESGTNVYIAAGVRVTTYDTMPRYHMPTSAIALDKTNIEGAPGDFFGSRPYYVYVFWDEAAARSAYQISEAPPDPWGFKTGADSRFRYLGAFVTDASARIVRFQRLRGKTMYYRMLNILSGGVETTAAELSCRSVVPFHATEIRLLATVNAAKDGFFCLTHKNAVLAENDGYYYRVSAGNRTMEVSVPLSRDGFRTLFYFVDSADTSLNLDVIGFDD